MYSTAPEILPIWLNCSREKMLGIKIFRKLFTGVEGVQGVQIIFGVVTRLQVFFGKLLELQKVQRFLKFLELL